MYRITVFVCLFTVSFFSQAQDEILGYWMAGEGASIIEIYKDEKNAYHGKVVWLAEPTDKKGRPKVDGANQDRALRGREIIGINMLQDLLYEEPVWKGTLYVPKRGRTVNATVSLSNPDELDLEISVMGRTANRKWVRTEAPK